MSSESLLDPFSWTYGSACDFSTSVPAIHATVAMHVAAAVPVVAIPHSAPLSLPSSVPSASIISSMRTWYSEALYIACFTSGREVDPLIAVIVPRQLISGRIPI